MKKEVIHLNLTEEQAIELFQNIDNTYYREQQMNNLLNIEITEENIEKQAIKRNIDFGDILLKNMGYNAECTVFCKCNQGGYNIAWIIENGNEYIHTFDIAELMK